MELESLYQYQLKKFIPWGMLIIAELVLAWLSVMFPYYAVFFLPVILLCFTVFFSPRFAYYLFILCIVNNLIMLQISFAFSAPLRLWRLQGINVDGIIIPGIITEFLIMLAFLSWVFSKMSKSEPAYPKTALDLPLLIFFAWAIISLFWAPDFIPGLIGIFMLIGCYLAFFLSVVIVRTKKIFNTVIWLLILVGVINALLAIHSLHNEAFYKELYRSENLSIFFTLRDTAKFRGTGLGLTLITSDLLNIVIMIAIGKFIVEKYFLKKCLIFFLILVIIFGQFTTLSKGGVISFIAGSFFFVAAYKPLRRGFFFVIPTIIIILKGILLILPFGWPWPERAEFFRERSSFFSRTLMWGSGFEDLIKSYGFGYGAGSFYPTHSIWLGVLFELGIIGLLIWLWLVFRLFFSFWSLLSNKSIGHYYRVMLIAFLAAIVSTLTFGLSSGCYYFEEKMWAIFGIGMALVNITRNSLSEKIPETAVV